MNLRLVLSGSVLLIALGTLTLSCKKDPASGTMNISLESESTAPYYEVNAYVKEIWAHYSTKKTSTNWQKLDIRPGFYDLLDLGLLGDTLIAKSASLTEGQLTQLRLVFESDSCYLLELGDPDFVRQPMPLVSTQYTGMKISVNYPIKGNAIMNLGLRIDTENSVLVDTEGGYQFDPKIVVDTVSYIE